VKHKGAPIGERYVDGGGMYLRMKAAGRYWRMGQRRDSWRRTCFPVWAGLSRRSAAVRVGKMAATLTGPASASLSVEALRQ
jgi:hypothetical protein